MSSLDPAETSRVPLAEARDDREYPDIGDYGLIGDCRSAALVSRQGSMDWLCWPDFSSPAMFAALLDRRVGGRFAVRPNEPFRTRRRYAEGTCVLETVFETADGRARLSDFMPIVNGDGDLQPQREILRIVEGIHGRLVFEILFEPRPGFGRQRPFIRRYGEGTVVWRDGNAMMVLRSDGALAVDADGAAARGTLAVEAGARFSISLAYCHRDMGVLSSSERAPARRSDTCRWWRRWSGRCRLQERYLAPAMRSAITLKLMCSALSGAVIAAPTTSLPEVIGGSRNWDYRYCWLRDASLTLRAFTDLGYPQEAALFLDWLLHTTRLTRPRLNVLYDIFGEHRIAERELAHLEGYRGSSPVRYGNAATDQVQLDVYGAVLLAAMHYVRRGGSLDRAERRMLAGFGKQVIRSWREPDHGIWEVRGRKRHYTYSKLMCWAALDALLELAETVPLQADREALATERGLLRREIESRGFNESLGSYVSTFDGDAADASLLAIARVGFHEPAHERMAGTWRFIEAELATDELVRRYPPSFDGLDGREGAMLLSSFWAVDYLARAGQVEEADRRFWKLLQHANDLGLMAEQADTKDGSALGNFPQAFSHVGIITAALSLSAAVKESPHD